MAGKRARDTIFHHHRHIMPRDQHAAWMGAANLPHHFDGRAAHRRVIGHVGGACGQLHAVLHRILQQHHGLRRAFNQEQQMPRRVARRKMRRDAGQHFLPIIHQLHGRPATKRFHRMFRHGGFAPTNSKRPGQFLPPHMNARIAEHGPIHHMIMVQMADQQIGHIR